MRNDFVKLKSVDCKFTCYYRTRLRAQRQLDRQVNFLMGTLSSIVTWNFCAETYCRAAAYRSGSRSAKQTAGKGNDFINVESNAFARALTHVH